MGKLDIEAHIADSIEVLNAQDPDSGWADKAMVLRIANESLESFPKDFEDLNKQANFLRSTKDSVESQTQQTVDMFRSWHNKASSTSLLAIIGFAVDLLEIHPDKNLTTALLTAAMLGEVYNEPAYHSNLHFREVTFQVLRLIITHNEIYKDTSKVLTDEEAALLLIAACLHDLGHTGKSNMEGGIHMTAKMELYSYMLSEPYLTACGLDRTQIQKIRTMLVATDVSPLGSDDSPMSQMKRIYKYHHKQNEKRYKPVLGEGLLMLEEDDRLSLMALLLHEADISISAGLSYDVTCYETTLLWDEMGRPDPRPSDIINFLEKVCHRHFLSEAGKRRFASNIARIYALAEDAVSNGDHPFGEKKHSNFILGITDDSKGKTVN